MKKNDIEKILKKKLSLNTDPLVVSFQKRKHSLLYEFRAGDKKNFLKIRKRYFYKFENFNEIISDEKIKKASKDEWESLNFYYKFNEDGSCPVRFIKPVAYIEEINGIVTEKTEGKDLWKMVKSFKFNQGDKNKRKLEEYFYRIGEGMAYLHEKTHKEEKETELNFQKIGNEDLDRKVREIYEKQKFYVSPISAGMSGFDVRDVLVGRDGRVYFLDLGSMEEKPALGMLASFLATMRIIYSGSLLFPFKQVDKIYEKEFLKGYFEDKHYDENLINLLVLEKLTGLYNQAIKKLDRKKIFKIPGLKWVVKKFYIDKFYYGEIREVLGEIQRLGGRREEILNTNF